jgi:hypothetical protein
MTKIKICVFSTFAEAKEAQNYDHSYMKAISFATVTGIDLAIIREKNLHTPTQNGYEALDQYIDKNNIPLHLIDLYNQTKKHWTNTTGWSPYFKYQDKFVYYKDHSDRSYNILEVNQEDLIPLDENGNEIEVESGT